MQADAAAVVRTAFLGGLRPDERVEVDDWADKYRYLSQIGAAEPGKYKVARTPYLREILRCLSPMSRVREIVFMKASQIGSSEAGFTWLGYIMHTAPGPTMMVQPNEDLAKKASKQRIETMIEETPVLRGKVSEVKQKNGENTALMKSFPGGLLVIASANSAPALRMMPIKNLMLDEIDAYKRNLGGEGSPIKLAEARTRTFARKKIFKMSTPTFEGDSPIEAAYDGSDRRRYHLPCPECGHYQWLKWSQLKWDKVDGQPDLNSIRYECEECKHGIKEHHKTRMLAAGKWIAENPGSDVAGFHLSALYSPAGWHSWRDMVKEWYEALKDPNLMRPFVNTQLGETFKVKSEDTPEWRHLYQRREAYAIGTVPLRGLVLIATVDVQKDRLEAKIVAWNRKESFVVDYRVLVGDTSVDETEGVWLELDKLLVEEFPHESGQTLPIYRLAIDSGYNTQRVYGWVRKHRGTARVMAIKGDDKLTMPIGRPTHQEFRKDGKRVKRGLLVWSVGSSHLKTDLYGRLRALPPTDEELAERGYPANFVHFPQLGEEYFRQLTAEHQVLELNNKGKPTLKWVKKHPANEALDLFVYSIAAFHGGGLDRWPEAQWKQLELELGASTKKPEARPAAAPAAPAPKPAAAPSRRESTFWARR